MTSGNALCRSARSSSVNITAPLVEFSKGTTPRDASPDWTDLKTSRHPQLALAKMCCIKLITCN